MKIRDRLALIYSLAVATVLLALSLFVYYFAATFREREFSNRLAERLIITEQLFLEAENLPESVYQDIRENFLHTLPEEIEIVLPTDSAHTRDSLLRHFSADFVEVLLAEGEVQFSGSNWQVMGRVYETTRGSYAVLVAATDVFGITKLNYLRKILIFGVLFSLIAVGLIARYATRQALLPIAETIRKARDIGASNLYLRLEVFNERDEIGELALTFNELLSRLETAFLIQKQFVSNASHEIKNPLTAIMGEAEVVLEKRRTPDEYIDSLQRISREADHLDALVSNLLHLANIGSDETQLRKDPIRIDELLWEVVESLGFRFPKHQIQIDLSALPEDPQQLEFFGNASLLSTALTNLLENASKFSHYKPVVVGISIQEEEILIRIKDQGIGIPESETAFIRQPFYRATNAREFKGFGMGLSLTDRIVAMHGGRLTLENQPTQGTIATIRLPLQQGF